MLAVVPRDRAVRRFALDRAPVGRDQIRRQLSERAKALREHVRLHVSVVILRRPDEAAGGFDRLRDHVVYETMLVLDTRSLKLFLVFAAINRVRPLVRALLVLRCIIMAG